MQQTNPPLRKPSWLAGIDCWDACLTVDVYLFWDMVVPYRQIIKPRYTINSHLWFSSKYTDHFITFYSFRVEFSSVSRPHLWCERNDLSRSEAELLVVIQHGVHRPGETSASHLINLNRSPRNLDSLGIQLNPKGIDRSIKNDLGCTHYRCDWHVLNPNLHPFSPGRWFGLVPSWHFAEPSTQWLSGTPDFPLATAVRTLLSSQSHLDNFLKWFTIQCCFEILLDFN